MITVAISRSCENRRDRTHARHNRIFRGKGMAYVARPPSLNRCLLSSGPRLSTRKLPGGQLDGGNEGGQSCRDATKRLGPALGWARVTASDGVFDLAAARCGRESLIVFDARHLVRELVVLDLLSEPARIIARV